jgi:hypothetical protein
MLTCKLGQVPMTYLGILVSDKVLRSRAFEKLVMKMNRLDPWKGKCNSSGGKLNLTNTCLISLPTYMIAFYVFMRSPTKI